MSSKAKGVAAATADWWRADDHWRLTKEGFRSKHDLLEAQLATCEQSVQHLEGRLSAAQSELATTVDTDALPTTVALVSSLQTSLPELVSSISTLQQQLDDLRRFVVEQTTAYHSSMATGMSEAELALIAEMNPFIVADEL